MNSAVLAQWAVVGLMAVGMIASLVTLAFKIGSLSGQLTSFIATSERDRAEQLKDIGRIEERYDRHMEVHQRSAT